jgi:hypothetical protein
MLFAASSGKAYGLNLVRDTLGGWRNAGYSEEKIARFGSRQVGLGWRKGNRQVSLTATRRALKSIDYSDKDELTGRYIDTTEQNFNTSLSISCYSFTAVAQRAEKLIDETNGRVEHEFPNQRHGEKR